MAPKPPRFLYLGPRPGSNYRLWFVVGRGIRAETLYRRMLGPEGLTPEQAAENHEVPVEAVREAIEYCLQNEELLRQEREADLAIVCSRGLDRRRPVPTGAGDPE